MLPLEYAEFLGYTRLGQMNAPTGTGIVIRPELTSGVLS